MADSLIDQALAAGIDPSLARFIPRIVQIESGGNPDARTGSYTGLLQMGPDERAKYGGDGLGAGLAMYRDRAAQFEKQYGRQPTPTEFYLANQQGTGGLAAHLGNPDAPAWQNMASTAEGRQKGASWAKQAIWGNVPTDVRSQYPGGVDSLTSGQFMDIWRRKLGDGAPQTVASASNPPSGPGADSPVAIAPSAAGASGGGAPGTSLPAAGMGMLSGADLSQEANGPSLGMLIEQAAARMPQQQMPAPPPISYPVPAALRARLAQAALGRQV